MLKYDKKGPTSFALGLTLAFEALEKASCLRLYLSPDLAEGETKSRLIAKAREKGIMVISNNNKVFASLSGKENVMAIAEFEKMEKALDPGLDHCLLVNPMNMGNLGTIMRSCLAFGVTDLALVEPCADPFDPKVIRSSMGAFFSLRLTRYKDFESYRSQFGERALYPFMLQAKTHLGEVDFPHPSTLVFGNEAKGLDPSFLEVGTPLLIKISHSLDSLNLDNAASIGLYELSKQRG